MTNAMSALFKSIHYGLTNPFTDIPATTAWKDYTFGGNKAAEEEFRVALTECLKRGWLQIHNESSLKKIADDLEKGGVLGPVYGPLPNVGSLDFTEAGAAIHRRLFGWPTTGAPFVWPDLAREKTAHYFQSRSAAITAMEEFRSRDEVVHVTGPTPIGPWRVQWWRRFPEGYRIDVEERMHWRGRTASDGENSYLRRLANATLHRLQQILNIHNISFAEWVLLAYLENGPTRLEFDESPWWIASRELREYGITISVEEYRHGYESCLRHNWLRVIDQATVDEVRTLLRDDPVFLALPRKAENRPEGCHFTIDGTKLGKLIPVPLPMQYVFGDIEFTPAGATLYRAISAEWLGPDWEDSLEVSNTYYSEEHHYCETEEGFEYKVQEHLAKGAARSGQLRGADWSLVCLLVGEVSCGVSLGD